MRIGTVELGPGLPCRVCAELSNAHNGDLDRLVRLMHAARDAGADLLKIQHFTMDELVALRGEGPAPEPWGSQGFTMRTLYEQAQTPAAWLPVVFHEAAQLDIPLFASVFGMESLSNLEAMNCPAYKISHFEAQVPTLAAAVCATGKPVIVSTGTGAIAPEYDDYQPLLLVWCPGGYPVALSDLQWERIPELRARGLSAHCRDPVIGQLAASQGLEYLEVHVQLAAEPSRFEAEFSYDESALAALVAQVRQAVPTS